MEGRGKPAQRATCEGVASERSEDATCHGAGEAEDESPKPLLIPKIQPEPVERVTEERISNITFAYSQRDLSTIEYTPCYSRVFSKSCKTPPEWYAHDGALFLCEVCILRAI